jgi:predicted acyltransferase
VNTIRSLMSLFLLLVIGAVIAGWNWAPHLPEAKAIAGRIVLSLSGLMALTALFLIWRGRREEV